MGSPHDLRRRLTISPDPPVLFPAGSDRAALLPPSPPQPRRRCIRAQRFGCLCGLGTRHRPRRLCRSRTRGAPSGRYPPVTELPGVLGLDDRTVAHARNVALPLPAASPGWGSSPPLNDYPATSRALPRSRHSYPRATIYDDNVARRLPPSTSSEFAGRAWCSSARLFWALPRAVTLVSDSLENGCDYVLLFQRSSGRPGVPPAPSPAGRT
jgi:hypothetical protein